MLNRRELIHGLTGVVGAGLASSTVASAPSSSRSAVIFVDAERGGDTEPGTKAHPLKPLAAAARLVNEERGTGAASRTAELRPEGGFPATSRRTLSRT